MGNGTGSVIVSSGATATKVKTLIKQAHEIRMNNERKQNQYIDYVQV